MTDAPKQNTLWLREMNCGHTRPTSLAFIFGGDNTKPKVGDECYCRECWCDTIVTKVIPASEETTKHLQEFKDNFEKVMKQ